MKLAVQVLPEGEKSTEAILRCSVRSAVSKVGGKDGLDSMRAR